MIDAGSPDEFAFHARPKRGTCAAGVVITMQRGCALLPRLPSAVASARVCARARATDLAFARSNPAPTFARRVSAAASGDPESGHREHFANHDDLVAALHGLTGDPLEADGGRVVVYRGDPRAKIMIIGEAPGAEEDKLGVPFVGRGWKTPRSDLRRRDPRHQQARVRHERGEAPTREQPRPDRAGD